MCWAIIRSKRPCVLFFSTTILTMAFTESFNNLWFCKWDPNDRTVRVDTYLKSPYFPASNGGYYNSLSSCQIFEFIPRISCIWDPNDRTVKVDTYLKSLIFCVEWRVLQLSQLISDFRVYTQDFVYMRPQWSHSKIGYILEEPYLFCVEW